jgi:hypothetical protein
MVEVMLEVIMVGMVWGVERDIRGEEVEMLFNGLKQ